MNTISQILLLLNLNILKRNHILFKDKIYNLMYNMFHKLYDFINQVFFIKLKVLHNIFFLHLQNHLYE